MIEVYKSVDHLLDCLNETSKLYVNGNEFCFRFVNSKNMYVDYKEVKTDISTFKVEVWFNTLGSNSLDRYVKGMITQTETACSSYECDVKTLKAILDTFLSSGVLRVEEQVIQQEKLRGMFDGWHKKVFQK